MSQINPKIERRSTSQPLNFNAAEGVIEGYAIVFEQRTDIGGLFYEEIAATALDKADLSDVKLLINHDNHSLPIARHRRGKRSTMDVEVDKKGFRIRATIDKNGNANASAAYSAIEREDVADMSFAMCIVGEEWRDFDKPMPIRRITEISFVSEVSVVNDGAYPQTEIYARGGALENEKRALDNARAAALENEKRAKENAQEALRLEIKKFLFLEEQKQ